MKKASDKIQETFDFFPSLNKWPDGYHDLIPKESLNYPIFGMDIETEGLDTFNADRRIKSIAISPLNGKAYSCFMMDRFSFDMNRQQNQVESITNFVSLCNMPDVIFVGHNIKYDINWISIKLGITIKCMLFDTMFAQYLLDENLEHNSLKEAVAKYIPELAGYKEEVDRNKLDQMSKDDLLIYNCKDADASRRLYDIFVPKLRKEGLDKLMITSSMVLPVLSKMETKGVYLDKEYAHKTQTKLFKELVSLRYQMSEIVKDQFNPDSSQDLSKVLYGRLQFVPTKITAGGKPSTDSEAIGYLLDQTTTREQNDFIDAILSYKKKIKLITTYYQPIERWTRYDGRVHTNYSLGRQSNEEGSGGTVTGRLSSSNPNLQNIPRGKEHRGMFAANQGYTLLDGDFSQLELRVAAFLSQEPAMIHAFSNGLDIHTSVMSGLTGIPYNDLEAILKDSSCKEYAKTKNDRVAFKEVNFGIFYGMSAKRLQRTLRVKAGIRKTIEECQDYINAWFAKYSKAKEWLDKTKLFAVSHKYVTMPLGQKRRLPDADFSYEGSSALRQATNFPVQSLASWICLIGLKLLDDYYQDMKYYMDASILMQVHDSITSEIKLLAGNPIDLEDIKVDVKRIMEVETLNYIKEVFGVDFNVPLVFDLEYKERWS
jgi:DNA polymerase-1